MQRLTSAAWLAQDWFHCKSTIRMVDTMWIDSGSWLISKWISRVVQVAAIQSMIKRSGTTLSTPLVVTALGLLLILVPLKALEAYEVECQPSGLICLSNFPVPTPEMWWLYIRIGVVTNLAGSGVPGFQVSWFWHLATIPFDPRIYFVDLLRFLTQDGFREKAYLSSPSGISVTSDGTVFVADSGNNRIRRVSLNGEVVSVAGSGIPGFSDDSLLRAEFNHPQAVVVTPNGHLFVADTTNNRIRLVDMARGLVTTYGKKEACVCTCHERFTRTYVFDVWIPYYSWHRHSWIQRCWGT